MRRRIVISEGVCCDYGLSKLKYLCLLFLFLFLLTNMSLCGLAYGNPTGSDQELITTTNEQGLSLNWTISGLEFKPLPDYNRNMYWAPAPYQHKSATFVFTIPEDVFSSTPYQTISYKEDGTEEIVATDPYNDESVSLRISVRTGDHRTVLMSRTISEAEARGYNNELNFLCVENHWVIDDDSPDMLTKLEWTQGIEVNFSRSGHATNYDRSSSLYFSCDFIPKSSPWLFADKDDFYLEKRELPLDKIGIIPHGAGHLQPGPNYENISLSKVGGTQLAIQKKLDGSFLFLTPLTPLDYDTQYEVIIPEDALTGITFNKYALGEEEKITDQSLVFTTLSQVKASYMVGYDLPFNEEKAIPLRLNFKSVFPNTKITGVALDSEKGFVNGSLFFIEDNGDVVKYPQQSYANVTEAIFDFNRCHPELLNGVPNAYYQNLTADVDIVNEKGKQTIRLPVKVKADAFYTVTMMEKGYGLYDSINKKVTRTEPVLLGYVELSKDTPVKVLQPETITMPCGARTLFRFIDGTAGVVAGDTDVLKDAITLRPGKIKVEHMASELLGAESSWGVQVDAFGKKIEGELRDKTLDFVIKKPRLAGPLGFILDIFTDTEMAGGARTITILRSTVGFSVYPDGGMSILNFEGTPEIVVEGGGNIIIPAGKEISKDAGNVYDPAFKDIDPASRPYVLLEQMDRDLASLDEQSVTYVGANGVTIESFSTHWREKEKLEALYQELLKNKHGQEMGALKGVKLYDGKGFFSEKGRAAGFYVPSVPEIHINYADVNTTVESVARVLSHEYGHHYTIYNMQSKENVFLGQSDWRTTPYAYARNITNDPNIRNDYEGGHVWCIKELAAEDYVQLLGSKASNKFSGPVQENPSFPVASEVPGLEQYMRELGGLAPQTMQALPKPSLSVQNVKKLTQSDRPQIEFTWNSVKIDCPATYMLALHKKDYYYPNWALYTLEDESSPLKTIYGAENGTHVFVLYAQDEKRNIVASNYVTATIEEKPGTRVVDVKVEDAKGITTYTLDFSVKDMPVDSVRLNHVHLTLVNGASETLIATISPADAPNRTVTWSSSDKTVATVNATGVVTARGEGTATISVLTEDNYKTASCIVTVIPKPYQDWPETPADVALDKDWTISFSKPVHPASIDGNIIITLDPEGTQQLDNVSVQLSPVDGTKVLLNPDRQHIYQPGTTYYLIIKPNIMSQTGNQFLKEGIRMMFST